MLVPLQDRAVTTGDEIAISSPLGTVTWTEANDIVLRLAAAIAAEELGPQRRVLVIARNRPSTVLAHAAAILAGACNVPANFHLTASEIAYQVAEADARLVFVDSSTLAATRSAIEGLAEGGAEGFAAAVRIVELPDEGARGPAIDEFVAGHEPLALTPDQPVRPSLLFTSGTTGRPKAVQLPPATVGSSPVLAGFVELLRGQRMARYGAHLVVGPLYHNGPLTAVRLLLAGVPLVVMPNFDATEALRLIEAHRIESSVMVPTHFVRLLALPADVRDAADVSTLRCIVHTGGACPVAVKHAMLEWFGPTLYESYGGTESGTTCSIGPEEWLAHPGSVGRPVAPFEVVIVDEDGNEVPAGGEGRLYFRDTTGRGVIYEGDPAKTAAAHIAPGVFTLGEIGKVDADGYVYITDRFSDMVVSGGVNLYPAETEQALRNHPAVVDAACFGVPDPDMGERLVAVVQLEAGAGLGAAELVTWCRETLAGYKCPKEIRFVDEVPRNPMGKIDKKTLRTTY